MKNKLTKYYLEGDYRKVNGKRISYEYTDSELKRAKRLYPHLNFVTTKKMKKC